MDGMGVRSIVIGGILAASIALAAEEPQAHATEADVDLSVERGLAWIARG